MARAILAGKCRFPQAFRASTVEKSYDICILSSTSIYGEALDATEIKFTAVEHGTDSTPLVRTLPIEEFITVYSGFMKATRVDNEDEIIAEDNEMSISRVGSLAGLLSALKDMRDDEDFTDDDDYDKETDLLIKA